MVIVADRISSEIWNAIVSNDGSYDHKFFYAIRTTGIFCKPSCKSKTPNMQNVYIFQTAKDALEASFRPCKRCKPTDQDLPDHAWVKLITEYIHEHYAEPLTLQTIADMCHGSPHHLHRTFKRIHGITPAEYIQQRRIVAAIQAILETDLTIHEIAKSIGIPNTPYFITLFKKRTGNTPGEYRDLYRKACMDKGEIQ
jgi:AraC family transcriptional regulator, regulatory protein of adaptative response / methylphosphotriester-DNA alkyltransferase methyltransferase